LEFSWIQDHHNLFHDTENPNYNNGWLSVIYKNKCVMDRYLFVADEIGTPGISPVISNTFVFGGYVVKENEIQKALDAWRKIKLEMCGRKQVELKWKHFFVDEHDPKFTIPLKVKNKADRRQLASLALKYLFNQAPLLPLVAIVSKDRATNAFIVKSKKGKDKIDYDIMWVGPIGMFATFLTLKKAQGKLCFDQLSPNQEKDRQDSWSNQLHMIRVREVPQKFFENLQKLLTIDERITFLDSKKNEIIQIAEFISGVIWNAGEGDEEFLVEFESEFGRKAERVGLGILHIK
jgi:hypothetical protein